MTPIEKAAQALHTIYTEEKVRGGARDMPSWDELGDDGQFYFKHRARAVLQAIREPSEGMKGAGQQLHWGSGNPAYEATDEEEAEHCGQIWQAMIDAALSE